MSDIIAIQCLRIKEQEYIKVCKVVSGNLNNSKKVKADDTLGLERLLDNEMTLIKDLVIYEYALLKSLGYGLVKFFSSDTYYLFLE